MQPPWLVRRLAAALLTGGLAAPSSTSASDGTGAPSLGVVPRHVAFIMDGNRRFADQLRLRRIDGHEQGYAKMKDIVRWCLELGVAAVSVYAFSLDNFKRPPDEVDALMALAGAKFDELLTDEDAARWDAELRVVGDLARAPPAIQRAAARLMRGSRRRRRGGGAGGGVGSGAGGKPRAVVNICFAYTSTQELDHAMAALARGVAVSQLLPGDVSPALLAAAMHTRECPPVDLLVRTSGEQRLSDFMLWQCGHALLHWERRLWPEFGYGELLRALLAWRDAAPALAALRAAADAAVAEDEAAAAAAAAAVGGASPPSGSSGWASPGGPLPERALGAEQCPPPPELLAARLQHVAASQQQQQQQQQQLPGSPMQADQDHQQQQQQQPGPAWLGGLFSGGSDGGSKGSGRRPPKPQLSPLQVGSGSSSSGSGGGGAAGGADDALLLSPPGVPPPPLPPPSPLLSMERTPSLALSSIDEGAATCCPHPSQALRTASFLQRLDEKHQAHLRTLAAE